MIGETIHLSGSGGGYDDMYLFLTGPNLAPGGVRLDSITTPVVTGNAASFNTAPVRSGLWDYEWDTGRTGGTLDPGTYMVWAVPQPLNRYDLGDVSYATIRVLLTHPVLTAEISGTTGMEGIETTTEKTAKETVAVTSAMTTGDEGIIAGSGDESEESQIASEDATPLPTTAGSFLYPFLSAAGIAVFFLPGAFRNEEIRYN